MEENKSNLCESIFDKKFYATESNRTLIMGSKLAHYVLRLKYQLFFEREKSTALTIHRK